MLQLSNRRRAGLLDDIVIGLDQARRSGPRQHEFENPSRQRPNFFRQRYERRPFRIELSQAVGSLESRFEPVIRHTESETEWPRSEPSSHFPVVD